MSSSPSPAFPFPVKLQAQPGMILRFVDAFPSAAAALDQRAIGRSTRRKTKARPNRSTARAAAEAARDEVVVVRL